MRTLVVLSIILLLPLILFAQNGAIVGKVTDVRTGEALMGANIQIEGTTLGAATSQNGTFEIVNVPPGTFTLKVTFIGYKEQTQEVRVIVNAKTTANFKLEEEVLTGAAISILADRAKVRETPVAFTNVEKHDMVTRLGSQDIPLVLNTTPSVYATMQGGGSGDARVNIRGFNQNNVAVMINGVPINDMENGWVYWSNWDGVGDATSSLQVQRGLSAINLATPSVGGTMNIITDPTTLHRGLSYKQELGNDGFLKSTLIANSGLIRDKYAFTAAAVRKVGDGLIDKTWTDAWAYYFGASWQLNKNNRIELYALGAPQRHGQNSYKQNIGVYSREFAEDIQVKVDGTTILNDYDYATFSKFKESERGRKYNQNWASISSSYDGKQYWNGSTHDRYNPNFLNERENYYHKPIVNLNWYAHLTDKLGLYSTVYYSGGKGGGTGTYEKYLPDPKDPSTTYGGFIWNYATPTRTADWDKIIAMNLGTIDRKNVAKPAGESYAILRNSVNTQWTIGAISKANLKLTKEIQMTAGVDWRKAEIRHFREVRDLLGGEYFIDLNSDGTPRSDFWTEAGAKRKLGDKIDYNFTNTVDWLGFFGQGEYSKGPVTAYGMGGYSMIKYTYANHFRKDATGKELTSETDWVSGLQVKGGASYRVTTDVDFFANAGYVSKVPIFDDLINDRTGTKAKDPKNEQFTSIEGGVNYREFAGKFALKTNFYYTVWKDKSLTVDVLTAAGTEGIIFIQGTDLLHRGIEVEAAYQPSSLFRLDGAASLGYWKYTDDVTGVYKDYSLGPGQEEVRETYYINGLKSGNAPQTQFVFAGSVFPIKGLQGQLLLRHYRNHYADWDPAGRTDPNDRAQSWKAPNYSVIDFHALYDLPFDFYGVKLQLFAHVFNILDTEYIQDATDNSPYNSYDLDHDADDAEVYFGLPRSFNIGLTVSY